MSSIKNLNLLILTIILCAYGYALPYNNGNSGSDQSSSAKVLIKHLSSSDAVITTHHSNSKRSIDFITGFDRQPPNNNNNNNVYINNGDGTVKMLNNVGSLSSYNSGAYNPHAEKRNIDSQRLSTNEVNENENNISPGRVDPTLSTVAEQNSGQTIPFSSSSRSSTINSNVNRVTGLDREAIIFPDSLTKETPTDSYGNPVTPYSVLPDESATRPTTVGAGIGHKTDVNRDPGFSGVDNKKDNFAFILPSYASGIMKLETYSDGHVPVRISEIPKPQSDLLPPLSSGNFKYPEIYKDSTKKPTQISTTSGSIDRVDTQRPINISPPSDSLVPPPLPAQPVTRFSFNQDSKTTTSYQAVQPTVSQFGQQSYQTTQNQAQPIPTLSSEVLLPPRPGSPPNFQSQQPIQQSQQFPTQPTFLQPPKQSQPQIFQTPQVQPPQQGPPTQQQNNAGKYIGSFGGAPGFLTPYNKPIIPPPTQLTAAPTIPSTQSTITTTYSTTSQLPQTTSIVQGIPFSNRFGDDPSKGKPFAPAPPPRDTSKDKYIGGFGGPPGILTPFDAQPASG